MTFVYESCIISFSDSEHWNIPRMWQGELSGHKSALFHINIPGRNMSIRIVYSLDTHTHTRARARAQTHTMLFWHLWIETINSSMRYNGRPRHGLCLVHAVKRPVLCDTGTHGSGTQEGLGFLRYLAECLLWGISEKTFSWREVNNLLKHLKFPQITRVLPLCQQFDGRELLYLFIHVGREEGRNLWLLYRLEIQIISVVTGGRVSTFTRSKWIEETYSA